MRGHHLIKWKVIIDQSKSPIKLHFKSRASQPSEDEVSINRYKNMIQIEIPSTNTKYEILKDEIQNPIKHHFKSRALQPSEDEVSINRSPSQMLSLPFPLVFLEKLPQKLFLATEKRIFLQFHPLNSDAIFKSPRAKAKTKHVPDGSLIPNLAVCVRFLL